jgi:hypothetical protein
MWTCSTCGEAHDDRFKDCWKCAGAEMEQATAPPPAAPLAPKQEQKVRSFDSILVRAAIAFVIGVFVGVAIASRTAASEPAEMVRAGLIVGLEFAGVVGVFVWVFYPYEPIPVRKGATSDRNEEGTPTTPID